MTEAADSSGAASEDLKGDQAMSMRLNRRRFVGMAAASGSALALPSMLGGSPAYAGSTEGARREQFLPSGGQFHIGRGRQRAVITEVGATLRSYSVAGREFLDTFAVDQMSDAARGQVLIPWPNRINHGRYTFEGMLEQLPLSEPGNDNAIHGLVRWLNWRLIKHSANAVSMSLILHPQDGYTFVLKLRIVYALSDKALTVRTTATNVGTTDLPFGAGNHPYLMVGTPFINTDTLRLPARRYFLTNSRLIPTGTKSVAGTPFDFRTPRVIGDVVMDTGFTDLIPDPDGFTRVTLSAPGGTPRVTVFMDSTHQFIQAYTGDTLPQPSRRRRGIAIEPYTCATNAFNNGLGLRVLHPGDSFTNLWGITAAV
jgi:aldose 1-epimerase